MDSAGDGGFRAGFAGSFGSVTGGRGGGGGGGGVVPSKPGSSAGGYQPCVAKGDRALEMSRQRRSAKSHCTIS